MLLKNRVVLITGAGSGLGQALAIAFCNQGSIVIGLGRNIDALNATHHLIKNSNVSDENKKFFCYKCDASDYLQVHNVVDLIVKNHGAIDFVFNNAAVYSKVNFVKESADEFLNTFNINVIGVSNICKCTLPIMINNKFGRIYNVGSFAHLDPIKDSAAYSASKGAIRTLTKAIAADVAEYNLDIEVHEWIPGHINTQMSGHTGIDPSIPAAWAVNIVQTRTEEKSTIFNEAIEFKTNKSLLRKVVDKMLMR